MIGIVAVSHSHALATAAVALATEMLHNQPVRIEVAAGLDTETLGTDAVAVADAISAADSGDGALVLMDLGSAVLSAELAVDLLDSPHEVRLCAAPFVEGLIAAAVSAAGGADLEEAASEAENALAGKHTHLGVPTATPPDASAAQVPNPLNPETESAGRDVGPTATGTFIVTNDHGLHARPATRLVAEVRDLPATVRLSNLTTGVGPASGRSLSRIAALGALSGHEIEVAATGSGAAEAVDRVLALAAHRFGESPTTATEIPPSPGRGTGANRITAANEGSGSNIGAADDSIRLTLSADADDARLTPADRQAGPNHISTGPGSPIEPTDAGHLFTAVSDSARPTPSGEDVGADTSSVRSSAGPLGASAGIGIGPVWRLGHAEFVVPETATGPTALERHLLDLAIAAVRADIERTRADAGPEADIFEAHLFLLDDDELIEAVQAGIDTGLTAASAWDRVLESAAAQLDRLTDDYQRARAADLRAVRDQVLGALLGESTEIISRAGILVAADLTPAQAAGLDRDVVTGIVLAQGSPTSHSAILARSRGIPTVVGAGVPVLAIPEGTLVVLDGAEGRLVIAPDAAVLAEFTGLATWQREQRRTAEAEAGKPAITRDGTVIHVAANIGAELDAAESVRNGADLAGLVRTEFLFLGRDHAPSIDEQEQAYRAVAEAFGGRRIVLRTLDVGGDKPLPYIDQPTEANPFLGVRGIRLALARPGLLRDQLTAIGRVAADHPVSVMFPMVTQLEELLAARRILDEVLPAGVTPDVGIMVEVPAAAAKTAIFAEHVDFFSIGTNDLTQYTLAAERGNDALSTLADPLDPGVLRLIAMVCEAAGTARVAVCGEAAADPIAAALLLGLGVHELSVAPPAIPLIKAAIRTLDLTECRTAATRALHSASATAVRAILA
ncbi:phosphoenolpyruvate--protein phosphotransferase [Nocardia australiensis]|uniref:phosphoenolpyruvate--protein phosphotransferase n=1 Tax=Nocardia australiensis TaxID=2887191 RepID=UPI001D134EBA|nr:phosphoenolpyruvate--protein phosphotransferase [Nocardia australiensis]